MNAEERVTLELSQSDEKYRLSSEQIEHLVNSFAPEYCCEIMIELGHTNRQIHEATGVVMQKISWMRVKYTTPPPRGELERHYRKVNIDAGFVHLVSEQELKFCKIFKCGIYHKNHQPLLKSRIRVKN